ncbi:hypothetical protein GCK72_012711 [Caenorhabditis remanei]|uniref:CUT domain-containing protein n=1 Tax=Caenorhabditis remanei TaxID=31234 RepID=A0A6A5GLQ1_CAERE|nr:hypothetical protein GCK72_012711 [Caenorhabditis remanei]KAF1756258.1 hypothetical protein GCK72_012711 [Caenorhabditis remanei]
MSIDDASPFSVKWTPAISYEEMLARSTPRPDTRFDHYQQHLHDGTTEKLKPIQMIPEEDKPLKVVFAKKETQIYSIHAPPPQLLVQYPQFPERSPSPAPEASVSGLHPPTPPDLPAARSPVADPNDITPEMAIKILDRPLRDESNPPDTREIVNAFNRWRMANGNNAAHIATHILGVNKTTVRDYCVTPQPWNELKYEKMIYLRMHNWTRLSSEARERIWEMDLAKERAKNGSPEKPKAIITPLPDDVKEMILNEMRQAPDQVLNEPYLRQWAIEKGFNYPPIKNFHHYMRSRIREGFPI